MKRRFLVRSPKNCFGELLYGADRPLLPVHWVIDTETGNYGPATVAENLTMAQATAEAERLNTQAHRDESYAAHI